MGVALGGQAANLRQNVHARIEPGIGSVLSTERAEKAFREMWEGNARGKAVFAR